MEFLAGVELPQCVQHSKRGRARFTHTYRWLEGVPLRDGADALIVNWLEIEIADRNRKITYRNSFITDLPIDADNVAELADEAWKPPSTLPTPEPASSITCAP